MKRLCLYPIILLVCLCLGCQKTAPAAEPTAAAQTAAPTATPAPVTELTLSDGEPLDVAAISGMTALKRLDMRAAAATAEQYDLIRAALPDCEILWRVPVGQTSLDSTETAVVLTDAAGLENLKYFPGLQSADLTSCTLTDDERLALIERYPNVAFQWAFTIEGVSVDSATETLDLSGKRISDPETLVKQLKCLPNLKKVDLCDCNLTDEQMGALCEQAPDIKLVWKVTVGGWRIRTDAIAFSKGNRNKYWNGVEFTEGRTDLTNEDIAPLKYCTDLIALDLGHARKITDLSILDHLPKLRFLIVAMEGITDFTPIGQLTELEYLETFQNYCGDLSPLLSLKKLTHLNCSTNIPADKSQREAAAAANAEVLKQMTGLKRLWCIRCGFTDEQLAGIRAALPNCDVNMRGDHSTDGWRDNDLYREMQDLFGLPALD